jgi:hypothetical protein
MTSKSLKAAQRVLGAALKKARESADLTRKQLAQGIGVEPRRIPAFCRQVAALEAGIGGMGALDFWAAMDYLGKQPIDVLARAYYSSRQKANGALSVARSMDVQPSTRELGRVTNSLGDDAHIPPEKACLGARNDMNWKLRRGLNPKYEETPIIATTERYPKPDEAYGRSQLVLAQAHGAEQWVTVKWSEISRAAHSRWRRLEPVKVRSTRDGKPPAREA